MSDKTPESLNDEESWARLNEGPSGELLGDEHLREPEQYELVDSEASELTAPPVPDATPDKADPADMVVDDPQELADAEAVAAGAPSSRPVRRNAPIKRSRRGPAAEEGPAEAMSSGTEAKALVTTPGRRPGAPVKRAGATLASLDESQLPAEQQKKGRPTRRRDEIVAEKTASGRKRTSPSKFVSQSVDELRKVIWPTQSQLTQYFVVVLAFVLFIIAFVGLLDLFFGWALLKVFGK